MSAADLLSPKSAAEGIVLAAAVVAALAVIWRQAVRPTWRIARAGWKKVRRVHDLIERELTHNGGASIKDQTLFATQQITLVNEQLNDVRAVQHATAEVLDGIVEQKQFEHDEIWEALVTLGVDRRRPADDRRPPADLGNGAT